MEMRKYPLSDEIKELTADALDELSRRLIDEAAARSEERRVGKECRL